MSLSARQARTASAITSILAGTWRDEAACVDEPTELFFPPEGRRGPKSEEPWWAEPVRICRGCPVVSTCLADALSRGEREGVWGGTFPEQRVAMLEARGRLPMVWR